MTMEYLVKYIVTETDPDGGDRITQLGGDGWQKKMSDIVFEIRLGTSTYYTFVNGERAEIHVVNDERSGPHVRTTQDNETTNNLLALPKSRNELRTKM